MKQGKCSHLVPLLSVSEGVSVRQMRLDTKYCYYSVLCSVQECHAMGPTQE